MVNRQRLFVHQGIWEQSREGFSIMELLESVVGIEAAPFEVWQGSLKDTFCPCETWRFPPK